MLKKFSFYSDDWKIFYRKYPHTHKCNLTYSYIVYVDLHTLSWARHSPIADLLQFKVIYPTAKKISKSKIILSNFLLAVKETIS